MSPTFPRHDRFARRHLGPGPEEQQSMLHALGLASMDALMDRVLPDAIRARPETLHLPEAQGEHEALAALREIAARNEVRRSYLGMGYYGTLTPPVIQRNILENPGWYTQYTPYQAEISQGRMEALLNFQTMVLDLTGMDCTGASLLDEATAAAEAMTLCQRVLGAKAKDRNIFFVADDCHPQTIAVVQTRAEPLGIEVVVAKPSAFFGGADPRAAMTFGALYQYPGTWGDVVDLTPLVAQAHEAGALAVVAADLLALTLLESPGACGADIAVGSSQRFGVPMGYGGPHAAFLSCREEYRRQMPGRIIGVSIDAHGDPALRLALATREQHIRREKATSNICTAQVLLAIMAGMYGVYHGPDGLRDIAERVRQITGVLAANLKAAGFTIRTKEFFDTITVQVPDTVEVMARADATGINLRQGPGNTIAVALDETVETHDLRDVLACFVGRGPVLDAHAEVPAVNDAVARKTPYLEHPVFHAYRSETEMLRYVHRLQAKDLSLTTSMIPLGSCTMKLNATAEMIPVTWPEFGALHPFAPVEQAAGYAELHERLAEWLADLTGFAATSLQPNAGSQGEYSGLLVIRAWHRGRGQEQRNICLIPSSAHGTNPASASMAGMKVVVVRCDDDGNIDVDDLRKKAEQHKDALAALMVTYPSTHGVFEVAIREICDVIHEFGGQVYMDGANLNAQLGHTSPGALGADVCHLNLHKTFCIPHGGGGPGMGPICVAEHLAPYLPGHPVIATGGEKAIGPVSAAPWGSPSILPISYAYIAMMGADGLREATEVAILNANYIAHRLKDHYPLLYTGADGFVAHECIFDVRPLEKTAGITVADVAKRLMDYGFHAPTMSFPVAGTLMIEPTESESRAEIDRFCDAMIAIRDEIRAIEAGQMDREDNPLKNAPHTSRDVCQEEWTHPYTREQAAFPAPWTRAHKFWPPVGRVNDVHGDRNLICSCPPMESYA